MELIYTTRTSGFEKGKHYRNPRHFSRPDSAATSVILDQEYPDVRKAYEDASVPVKTVAAPKPKQPAKAAKTEKPVEPEAPKE
ncbi:hypothetical protein [Vreelandella maris]|uniref:hypothetical protein n=1 Tax=Vreelandella maris TaxID=2729617 RepID=UPI0030EBDA51